MSIRMSNMVNNFSQSGLSHRMDFFANLLHLPKFFMRHFLICLSLIYLMNLTSCSVSDINAQHEFTNVLGDNRMLIVLSAPSVNDSYYRDVHQQIIEFQVAYAKAIIGNDNVLIIADKDTIPLLKDRVPDDILLEERIADIWVRDFGTVNPSLPVRFKYRPSYFEFMGDAVYIQNSFESFARRWELSIQTTDLILDGGNIVDNYKNMVITTERFLEDNQLNIPEGQEQLRNALGVEYVAIIPYDDEILGHADGMVMFADENTLMVNRYDETFRSQVLDALRAGLPDDVQIIEVDVDFDETIWDGFVSACGINLNATVTKDHIYVPVFNGSIDEEVFELISENTEKQVHPVNAEEVCFMGGSVRCLSWQLEGENARKLIEGARME